MEEVWKMVFEIVSEPCKQKTKRDTKQVLVSEFQNRNFIP